MIGWFNKVNGIDTSDKDRINELERELSRSGNALAEERLLVKRMQDSSRSVSFEFDFKAVKAFSVERNLDSDKLPVTIIGYLLPEPVTTTEGETTIKDVVREWYLRCDEKQHELVVKAFRESRK